MCPGNHLSAAEKAVIHAGQQHTHECVWRRPLYGDWSLPCWQVKASPRSTLPAPASCPQCWHRRHGQAWQRTQKRPSLQPLDLLLYLQAAAQKCGWPIDPTDNSDSSSPAAPVFTSVDCKQALSTLRAPSVPPGFLGTAVPHSLCCGGGPKEASNAHETEIVAFSVGLRRQKHWWHFVQFLPSLQPNFLRT